MGVATWESEEVVFCNTEVVKSIVIYFEKLCFIVIIVVWFFREFFDNKDSSGDYSSVCIYGGFCVELLVLLFIFRCVFVE